MNKKLTVIYFALFFHSFLNSMGEKTEYRDDIPPELLDIIHADIIKVSPTFEQAVEALNKFENIEYIKNKKLPTLVNKDNKNLTDTFSNRFKMSPLIVANRLGTELTEEEIKNYKDRLLVNALENYKISNTDLTSWINQNLKPDKPLKEIGDKIIRKGFATSNKEPITALLALLDRNLDPNFIDFAGFAALTQAVLDKNKNVVEILLNFGANPNAKDGRLWSALKIAVKANTMDIVKLLLKAGADPNIQDNLGYTALMEAIEQQNIDMVKLLLAVKSDINLKTYDGKTAMSIAQKTGNVQIEQLLQQAESTELEKKLKQVINK